MTVLDRGVRVERWIENATGFRGGPPSDGWSYYDFMIPGVLLLGHKSYPAGTAAACNGEAPTSGALSQTFSCQAVTPITDKTSRYFFSWGPRTGEGAQAMADMLIGIARKAFAEDKAIIEGQQTVVERSPGISPMPTKADQAVLAYQRLVARLIRAEAANQVSSLHDAPEKIPNPTEDASVA